MSTISINIDEFHDVLCLPAHSVGIGCVNIAQQLGKYYHDLPLLRNTINLPYFLRKQAFRITSASYQPIMVSFLHHGETCMKRLGIFYTFYHIIKFTYYLFNLYFIKHSFKLSFKKIITFQYVKINY